MLKEKPFDKITVSALVKRCEISRNTFYYHYQDIFSLLDDWLVQWLGNIIKGRSTLDHWHEAVKALLYECKAQPQIINHVLAAAKKACCHDFIMSLPDGYSTVIGEGGATLSDGEKQRISNARAILKDAPIIILDEATANVDPENEDKLIAAFDALTENKTAIMIAHRLKTIRNADQIVVLDGGAISSGTHDELLQSNEKYGRFIKLREEAASWKMQSV